MLRKRRQLSQEEAAQALQLTRSSLSGYENGIAEPNYENLIALADFFTISVDHLLKTDLEKTPPKVWAQFDKKEMPDLTGKQLRILSITIDKQNEENIELVPLKAKAGYTRGYADPDFIGNLKNFHFPFLDKNKTYRAFQIEGDSMPPVPPHAWVIGEYVQDWNTIKDTDAYIILTKEQGIVFKVVFNKIKERHLLLLCSTNTNYEPYEVNINEVREIWRFKNYISEQF